jgi:hypothetical protein
LCTHCQVAAWLIEFRPILNRHGVDIDHHSMWLISNDGNLPRIAWPGHPDDGMWRESYDANGHVATTSIPIRKVTGGIYSIDVDENVSPAQILLQYHADEQPPHGNMPYTFGVIAISLSDLGARYFCQRCGVATEIAGADLPAPLRCIVSR